MICFRFDCRRRNIAVAVSVCSLVALSVIGIGVGIGVRGDSVGDEFVRATAFDAFPFRILASADASQSPAERVAFMAAAAGVSVATAQSAVNRAVAGGTDLLNPPAFPESCAPRDFRCQFLRSCYSCYANAAQSVCYDCIRLQNCGGVIPCEMPIACDVCRQLPSDSVRPSPCHYLGC